jgi:hypothetical protein
MTPEIARGHQMQPVSSAPDTATAAPAPKAAPVQAKSQAVQFPYQSHCAIDASMKQSIERLARKWRWKEAQVHRTALIFYLSTNDPVFARENQSA